MSTRNMGVSPIPPHDKVMATMVAACDACSNADTGFAELATRFEAIIAAAGKASKAGGLAAIAYNLAEEARTAVRRHSDELEAGLKDLRASLQEGGRK